MRVSAVIGFSVSAINASFSAWSAFCNASTPTEFTRTLWTDAGHGVLFVTILSVFLLNAHFRDETRKRKKEEEEDGAKEGTEDEDGEEL